jgi:hypothetical protein
MATDIRLPVITSGSDHQQLAQVKSYLYQLVEHLNYALTQVDRVAIQTQESVQAVQKAAGTGKTAQDTFNEIKGLIISSADIVNAYYQEIDRRLSSEYVAVSDFGTYKQEVQTDYALKSDLAEMLTQITEEIDAGYIKTLKGTIKAGLIDEDVYGIEIGQITTEQGVETFNKYARFTAGSLEFYLPGSSEPVAYMTNNELVITNATIKYRLTLGKYVLDTTDGLKFIWAG